MGVQDVWHRRDGTRTSRYGHGKRWRARWRDFDQFFDSKGAAERAYLRARTEVRRPQSAPVTIGQLVDRWLAGKQGLSTSRIQGCTAAAARVTGRWADVPADQVTEQDVREWQAGLQVGPSSIRKAMECLSGALNIAVRAGVLDRNPCTDVRRPVDRKRDARFLTPTELELLADRAGPDRAMILLMGTTGLRIGEVCNLRVGDIDRARRRLWVASATAKTRKGREVGIPASVLALLPLAGRRRTDWLFTAPAGGQVRAHNWRARQFARTVAAAELGHVTPHDLRHTAVSLAIKAGADLKTVQNVAGHASAKLTYDTYAHLFDQGIDDVAALMDALLSRD